MTNKDYFEFYWGQHMSYEEFCRLIGEDVRPMTILKRVPMTHTAFYNWKKKVQRELEVLPNS